MKRLISVSLVLIMFFSSTINVIANDEGLFKNVVHNVELEENHEELCLRDLTGEIYFDWPKPSTFVDVVFIQDFSGSFKETIDKVGEAVNTIIDSLDMGLDIDG